MAIRGIASNSVSEYICAEDPCRTLEEGATVFYHVPIPNAIISRISDQVAMASTSYGDLNTQTFQQRTALRNRECFRFGIGASGKGWDNLAMGDGTPIPFETEIIMEGGRTYTVVSDTSMDKLLLNTIQEVGNHIWSSNTMTEEQRKKFAAWSSPLGGSSTSAVTTAPLTSDENEDAKDQPSGEDQPPEGAAVMSEGKVTNTGKTPARRSGKTAAPAD